MERSVRAAVLACCLMLCVSWSGMATAQPHGASSGGADVLLAQGKSPAPTSAQRERKLAEWRVARDCSIFLYARFRRIEQAGDKARADEAEYHWLDWDDIAMDIEIELDMDSQETVAVETKMEAVHNAQIARSGWTAYEKAWMRKCGKVPG